MKLCLMTIIIPASLEEIFVDWFMEQENLDGFSSSILYGHGTSEQNMSMSERVTGRSKKIMFQIHLSHSVAEIILAKLKNDFKGSQIHYMLAPLLDAGRLENYQIDD